jgi:hypothetical protein
LRDATGTLATSLTNPLPLEVGAGQGLIKLHDNEKEIKSTRDSSLDGYIAKRKAYSRCCASQIRNGTPSGAPVIEFVKNPEDEKK